MRYFLVATLVAFLTTTATAWGAVPAEVLGRTLPLTSAVFAPNGTEDGSYTWVVVGAVTVEATDTVEVASRSSLAVRTISGTSTPVWDPSQCGTSLTAGGASYPPGSINCGGSVSFPLACYRFKRFHPLNLKTPYMQGQQIACIVDAPDGKRDYVPTGIAALYFGQVGYDEALNKPDCPMEAGTGPYWAKSGTGHPAFWVDVELMRSTCGRVPYDVAMREAREVEAARPQAAKPQYKPGEAHPGSNVTQACKPAANAIFRAVVKAKRDTCVRARILISNLMGGVRLYGYKCTVKFTHKGRRFAARCTKGRAVVTGAGPRSLYKPIKQRT